MYKVFINDKEVRFLNETASAPENSYELNRNLKPQDIVNSVYTFKDQTIRIFISRHPDPLNNFEKFKTYFPIIQAAGGIVRHTDVNGAILLIHRLGKWDLPKGKIDAGESAEAAALREVQEECGIGDLKIVKQLSSTYHLYEHKGVTVMKETFWYLMLSSDNGALTPQQDEGITEVKWVALKDIYYLLPRTWTSIADLISKEILNS